MTTKKSKRASSGAGTSKWFITAASVAAMLGGWAALSAQPANGADPATQILTVNLGLEPIPTVVPAPVIRQNLVQEDSQPAQQQVDLPVLRSVTLPAAPRPRAVTVTRSSR